MTSTYPLPLLAASIRLGSSPLGILLILSAFLLQKFPKPSLRCPTSRARWLSILINSLSPFVSPFLVSRGSSRCSVWRPSPSSLLVLQQLQRINQLPAKALRYCMCPEDLGLINTFTCLQHQEPVLVASSRTFLHTSRANCDAISSPEDPPNVVFQRETVTMRTQI